LLIDFKGHNRSFLFGQDLFANGIAELKWSIPQGLVQGLLSELGDWLIRIKDVSACLGSCEAGFILEKDVFWKISSFLGTCNHLIILLNGSCKCFMFSFIE
jgi:hypothetical protein